METLKGQVRLQANALLSTDATREAITTDSSAKTLQERLEQQQAYSQQCLYRACAGITTFRVRDPDPNAVDGGRVLGIRIEVMTRAKFLRPYYVFLNRPFTGSERRRRYLSVHRNTVPPCIPLNGLAARYLPAPRPAGPAGSSSAIDDDGNGAGESTKGERRQDLSRFVRTLRREAVRYHNRVAVIADLRKAVGLDGKRRRRTRARGEHAEESPILAISAADAEAKQVRIDWKDGRSGRLVIGDDGDVVKLVVVGEGVRDREVVRELLSEGSRLEDVARRLETV